MMREDRLCRTWAAIELSSRKYSDNDRLLERALTSLRPDRNGSFALACRFSRSERLLQWLLQMGKSSKSDSSDCIETLMSAISIGGLKAKVELKHLIDNPLREHMANHMVRMHDERLKG
jgi:hypothetical protein